MTTSTSDRLLLTRYRAAELLSMGLNTLDSLVRDGRIKAVRVNRRVLFARTELERFAGLAAGQQPTSFYF